MKKFYLGTLTVLLFFSLGQPHTAHAGRRAPLMAPEVGSPCALSVEQVRRSIHSALTTNMHFGRWTAIERGPGLIEATLHVRAHMLTVNIAYDAKSVKFSYKDSYELLYKKDADGKEFIHYRANTWLQNTGTNIYYALNNICRSQSEKK